MRRFTYIHSWSHCVSLLCKSHRNGSTILCWRWDFLEGFGEMGVKFNPAILKSVETHGEGVLVFDRICCCIKKRSCGGSMAY